MDTAVTILRMLVRLAAVIQIVLGLLFWFNQGLGLIPVHIMVGMTLVVVLWVLALLAARAGAPLPSVGVAIVWGVIVIALGMNQTRILPGSFHWIIEVLHLVVGVAAVGMAEGFAARIAQRQTAMRPA